MLDKLEVVNSSTRECPNHPIGAQQINRLVTDPSNHRSFATTGPKSLGSVHMIANSQRRHAEIHKQKKLVSLAQQHQRLKVYGRREQQQIFSDKPVTQDDATKRDDQRVRMFTPTKMETPLKGIPNDKKAQSPFVDYKSLERRRPNYATKIKSDETIVGGQARQKVEISNRGESSKCNTKVKRKRIFKRHTVSDYSARRKSSPTSHQPLIDTSSLRRQAKSFTKNSGDSTRDQNDRAMRPKCNSSGSHKRRCQSERRLSDSSPPEAGSTPSSSTESTGFSSSAFGSRHASASSASSLVELNLKSRAKEADRDNHRALIAVGGRSFGELKMDSSTNRAPTPTLDRLRHVRPTRKRSVTTYFEESIYFKHPTWQTDLADSDLSAYASSSEAEHDNELDVNRATSGGPRTAMMRPNQNGERTRRCRLSRNEAQLKLFEDLNGFGDRVAKFSSTDDEAPPAPASIKLARKSVPRLQRAPKPQLARQQAQTVSSYSLDLLPKAGELCEEEVANHLDMVTFADLKGEQSKTPAMSGSPRIKNHVVLFNDPQNAKQSNPKRRSFLQRFRRPRFGYWPLNSSSFSFSFGTSTTTNRTTSIYSTDPLEPDMSRPKHPRKQDKSMGTITNQQPQNWKQLLQQNLVAALVGAYILLSFGVIVVLMLPYLFNNSHERPYAYSMGTQTVDNSEMVHHLRQPHQSPPQTINQMALVKLSGSSAPAADHAQLGMYDADRLARLQANQWTSDETSRVAPPKQQTSVAPLESAESTAMNLRRLEQQQQQDLLKKKRILARINQMRAEAKARESEDFQELWRVVHKRQCAPLKIPFCSRSLGSMLPESATINANFMASLPASSRDLMAYDKTLLPNQFTMARQSQVERVLERYDPLVDVRCYALMPLFLCSIYAPKCIQINATVWSQNQLPGGVKLAKQLPADSAEEQPPDVTTAADYLDHLFPPRARSAQANRTTGEKVQLARLVPPCRSVCMEALKKCTFFLEVLSLQLLAPDDCDNLPESSDESICVGQKENQALERAKENMKCRKEEFRCNNGDCIPEKWHCDGFTDCSDKSDEEQCSKCDASEQFYCGNDVCISKRQVCDGRIDCKDGRDERLCLRLAHNATGALVGKKPHLRRLEAWNATLSSWTPVCGYNWQAMPMSHEACQALAYSRANETLILFDSPTKLSNSGRLANARRLAERSPPILDHSVTYEQRNGAQVSGLTGATNKQELPDPRHNEAGELKRALSSRIQPMLTNGGFSSSGPKSLVGLLALGAQSGCQPLPDDQLISTIHLSCHGFQCGRSVTSYLTRVNLQQLNSLPGPPMISSVAIAANSVAPTSLNDQPENKVHSTSSSSRSAVGAGGEARDASPSFFVINQTLASDNMLGDDLGEDEHDLLVEPPDWLEDNDSDDTTESEEFMIAQPNSLVDSSSGLAKRMALNMESADNQQMTSRTPISSRLVVGGIESMPGEFPYLAALHGGPDEVFFCGGVLISANWLLTAAHCVGNRTQPDGWMVKVGVTRRIASPAFVRKLKVRLIVKHHLFNVGGHLYNDIALIQLTEHVEFNQYLRPICLPHANLLLGPDNSKDCVVVGFGKSRFSQEANYLHVAHFARVPIVNRHQCSLWYAEQDVKLAEGMLCAGYSEGKRDACQGDSGSGLFCRHPNTNQFFVAGVVSFGIKCATPKLPGVYTSVPHYIDWINQIMSENGHPVS